MIVSSSIDNQVFSPAPANVTDVVTFNQPMDTTFTTASDFTLTGTFTETSYAAASFTWDPTGTILTINFTGLPADDYTLTLLASGFQNVVGLKLVNDYTSTFAVAHGVAPFSGTFTAVKPLGSLIYTATDSGVLSTPGGVDDLTILLNAGETLTLIGTPNTSDLQLVLTILDPSGNVVATTTATAQGQNVVIETAPVTTTGTYSIEVSDANGNVGLYSIQAYLNTAVKTGTSNDTIATAQDLTPTSYVLDSSIGIDRLAVVGSLPANSVVSTGDVFVSSKGYGDSAIYQVNAQGTVVQVIPVPEDTLDSLSGVELDPVNNMLYAAVTTAFNGFGGSNTGASADGELLEFNPVSGQLVATIPLPADNANFYYDYPDGFSIDSSGDFWIAQPNSQNIIELDPNGNEIVSYSTASITPLSASIGTDGNVYFSGLYGPEGNAIYQLITATGGINFFASSQRPNLTSTAPGGAGIWSGDTYQGATLLDYSGNPIQQVGYENTSQAQTDQDGNVWTANFGSGELFKFAQDGSEISSTSIPDPIGLTIWGVDNPNPPTQDTQDYYSFSLYQGQTATVVAQSQNGQAVEISIVDGNGDVLATGVVGASNVSSSIEDFVAPSTGTYYVEVSGQVRGPVQRGRHASRDHFSLQPHYSITTAQNLTGSGGVLGYLTPPPAPFYVLDDQFGMLSDPNNPIYPADPATGQFTGPAIAAPGNPFNNAYGLNMAFDGTDLYYNNGAQDGNNAIYKIDPSSGAVLDEFVPMLPNFTGLAYLNGGLWATDLVNLYELDPNNGACLQELPNVFPGGGVTGLTADPNNGMLYAVSQNHELYEIDPASGAMVNSAT